MHRAKDKKPNVEDPMSFQEYLAVGSPRRDWDGAGVVRTAA